MKSQERDTVSAAAAAIPMPQTSDRLSHDQLSQLFADHHHMGALNFYAEQARAFDEEAVEMGLILATHAAVAWNMVQRDEQFRSALASRDIIGQAKGMIMERFRIDAVQAFELLKRLSQSSNTALVVVARQLVESERHS